MIITDFSYNFEENNISLPIETEVVTIVFKIITCFSYMLSQKTFRSKNTDLTQYIGFSDTSEL